ncbi:MAG: hypothetical protein ACM3VT_17045 [Solirubrobacterales bacterium]
MLGFVLLLFVWGGAADVHRHYQNEAEHHHPRVVAQQAVVVSDRSGVLQTARPRMRPDDTVVSAMVAWRRSGRGPTSLGTLLSLSCLLSI